MGNLTIETPYDGPDAAKELWREYAHHAVFEGQPADQPNEAKLRAVNLLNELVFKNEHIHGFLGELKQADASYQQRLGDIRSAVKPLAELSADEHFKPLYQEVIRRLMAQWITIRNTAHIDPDGLQKHKKGAERKEAIAQRKKFLAQPDAYFLADAIHAAIEIPLKIFSKATLGSRAKQFEEDSIDSALNHYYTRAIFSYKDDKKAIFTTYLYNGVRQFLWPQLSRDEPESDSVSLSTVLDSKKGDGGELGSLIADAKAEAPDVAASDNEQRHLLHLIVAKYLNTRDAEIIRLRFGLNDGVDHTLEEIAAVFNLTREGIRQIEVRVLGKLREILERGIKPTLWEPSSAVEEAPAPVPTAEPKSFFPELVKHLSGGHQLPPDEARQRVVYLAKVLGVHPWVLEGHAPLPKGINPYNVAYRLNNMVLGEYAAAEQIDDTTRSAFFETTAAHLSQRRPLDIVAGQNGNVKLNFAEMFDTLVSYKTDSNEFVRVRLKKKGITVDNATIASWRNGTALPHNTQVIEALVDVLGLSQHEEELLQAAYREAKQHADKNINRALNPIDPDIRLKYRINTQAIGKNLGKLLSDNKAVNGDILFGSNQSPLKKSQAHTLADVGRLYEEGHNCGGVVLPGGVGKTRIGAALTKSAHQLGKKTLIVVPSLLALQNTCTEFSQVTPEISIGRIYEAEKQYGQDVTVITYASLVNEFYDYVHAKLHGKTPRLDLCAFDVIIADEGHHYLTELATNILRTLPAAKLAMTATPRADHAFGGTIKEVKLTAASKNKEIAPLSYRIIRTGAAPGSDAWNRTFADTYAKDQVKENHAVFGEPALVFCASIQHAKDMATAFNDTLMPILKDTAHPQHHALRDALIAKHIDPDKVKYIAAPVWGMQREHNTDRWEGLSMEQILEMYKRREILALSSNQLLQESVNLPLVSVVLRANPSFSEVAVQQEAYRGSRLQENKTWLVYDAIPAIRDANKPQPYLFGELIFETAADAAYYQSHTPHKRKPSRTTAKAGEQADYEVVADPVEVIRIVDGHVEQKHRLQESLWIPPAGFAGIDTIRKQLIADGYDITKGLCIGRAKDLLKHAPPPIDSGAQRIAIDTAYGTVHAIVGWQGKADTLFHSAELRNYLVQLYDLERKTPIANVAEPVIEQGEAEYISRNAVIQELAKRRDKVPLERWMNHLLTQAPATFEYYTPFALLTAEGKTIHALFGKNALFDKIPFFKKDEIFEYLNQIQAYSNTSGVHRKLTQQSYSISLTACAKAIKEVLEGQKLDDIALYLPHSFEHQKQSLKIMRRHDANNNVELVLNTDDWARYVVALYQMQPTKPIVVTPDEQHFSNASQITKALKDDGYSVDKKTVQEIFQVLGTQIPDTHPNDTAFSVNTEHGVVEIKRIKNNHGISYLAEESAIKTYIINAKRLAEAKIPAGHISCAAVCDKIIAQGYSIDRDDVVKMFKTWQATAPEKYKPFTLDNGIPAAVVYDRRNQVDALYAKEDEAVDYVIQALSPVKTQELEDYLGIKEVCQLPECRKILNFERRLRAKIKEISPEQAEDAQGTGRKLSLSVASGRSVRAYIKGQIALFHKEDITSLIGAITQNTVGAAR